MTTEIAQCCASPAVGPFQENVKLMGCCCAILRVVQFLPDGSHDPLHDRNGGRDCRPHLERGRVLARLPVLPFQVRQNRTLM